MFPDNDFDFDLYQQQMQQQNSLGKSFLYDFTRNDFVLRDGKFIEITEKEVIQQWIEKCIRTEKDKFKIYTQKQYGVPLEQLIRDSKLPRVLLESELEREIKEALTQHFLISDIINFEMTKNGTICEIHFGVITTQGYTMEVEFNV